MTTRQKSAVLWALTALTFLLMCASVILTSPSPFSAYLASLEPQASNDYDTQPTTQGTVPEAPFGKVNVNEATPEELLSVKGMTQSVVMQIMAYRESYRRFDSFEDLNNLKGVSDGMIALWKDVIIFE